MKTPPSIRRIDTQLATVEPGSLRHHVLAAARDFKTSWIALGRALSTVFKDRAYKEWGYLTFEAYCAKEIGIQALTARKLLRSYLFLERHEPRLLPAASDDEPAAQHYPTYEAVDVLRQAKEGGRVSEPAYRELRERVFEQGEAAPTLRKELRLVMRRSQPPAEMEAAAARAQQATLRRLVGTLRTLHRTAADEQLLAPALLAELQRLIQRVEASITDAAD